MWVYDGGAIETGQGLVRQPDGSAAINFLAPPLGQRAKERMKSWYSNEVDKSVADYKLQQCWTEM